MDFNPFAYDFHADPYPTYGWLRDEAPAYHNERMGFWALSRFADVLDALHDHHTYTSTQGVALEQQLGAQAEVQRRGAYGVRSLIETDPPVHTSLRKTVARQFTPRRVADLEAPVTATARRLLAGLDGRPAFDVVSEFTALLPTTVVATMLGFPPEHHDDLRRWTDMLLHREPGNPTTTPAGVEAMTSMLGLAATTLAERRHSPADDLLTLLVEAEVDGQPLTDAELLGFCLVLIAGGHETTSKLIANGVRLLARHRDQRAALVADRSMLRGAVEELLRYTSPTQYMARATTRDVEIHGRVIPEGAKVALLLGSGNRDPREFDRPDDFDIARPNSRILAFGHGPHACLGAAVARMEARIALDLFLDRYPVYDVDESGIEVMHSGNVHGPTKVPVSVS